MEREGGLNRSNILSIINIKLAQKIIKSSIVAGWGSLFFNIHAFISEIQPLVSAQ